MLCCCCGNVICCCWYCCCCWAIIAICTLGGGATLLDIINGSCCWSNGFCIVIPSYPYPAFCSCICLLAESSSYKLSSNSLSNPPAWTKTSSTNDLEWTNNDVNLMDNPSECLVQSLHTVINPQLYQHPNQKEKEAKLIESGQFG